MGGRTSIDGKLIEDKSVDGDDLKDSIVINADMSPAGGLVVMGSTGHLVSASAGSNTVSLNGTTALVGPVSITSGSLSVDASSMDITGSLNVLGSITGTGAISLSGSMGLTGSLEIDAHEMTFDASMMEVTGTLAVVGNIMGSVTKLANGSPFLLAGPGVQLSTGSSGAIAVSSSIVMPATSPLPTPTTPGRMMYDQDNLYIAIDANTWKKVGLSSI